MSRGLPVCLVVILSLARSGCALADELQCAKGHLECGRSPGFSSTADIGTRVEEMRRWCGCVGGSMDGDRCTGVEPAACDESSAGAARLDATSEALKQLITTGHVDSTVGAAAGVELGVALFQSLLDDADQAAAKAEADRQRREAAEAERRRVEEAERERQRQEVWRRLSAELHLESSSDLHMHMSSSGELGLHLGGDANRPVAAAAIGCATCAAKQQFEARTCDPIASLIEQAACVNDVNQKFLACENGCDPVPATVQLDNLRRAVFLAHNPRYADPSQPERSLDLLLSAAGGDRDFDRIQIPPDAPAVDAAGLQRFTEANQAYREAWDWRWRTSKVFAEAEKRRAVADALAVGARDDEAKALKALASATDLAHKHAALEQVYFQQALYQGALEDAQDVLENATAEEIRRRLEVRGVIADLGGLRDAVADTCPPLSDKKSVADERDRIEAKKKLLAMARGEAKSCTGDESECKGRSGLLAAQEQELAASTRCWVLRRDDLSHAGHAPKGSQIAGQRPPMPEAAARLVAVLDLVTRNFPVRFSALGEPIEIRALETGSFLARKPEELNCQYFFRGVGADLRELGLNQGWLFPMRQRGIDVQATQIIHYLGSSEIWRSVCTEGGKPAPCRSDSDLERVQQLANEGKIVVGTELGKKHSHLAIVSPAAPGFDPGVLPGKGPLVRDGNERFSHRDLHEHDSTHGAVRTSFAFANKNDVIWYLFEASK